MNREETQKNNGPRDVKQAISKIHGYSLGSLLSGVGAMICIVFEPPTTLAFFLAILAFAWGVGALRVMRKSPYTLRYRWIALAGIIMGIMTLFILISVYIHYLGDDPRKQVRLSECQNHLTHIRLSIQIYTQDYGGRLPPSLDVLQTETDIDKDMLQCPSVDDSRGVDYKYMGKGLTVNDVHNTVIVFDKKGNHQGYTNVVLGLGGAILECKGDSINEVLQQRPELKMPREAD